jgi:hypothetical protein
MVHTQNALNHKYSLAQLRQSGKMMNPKLESRRAANLAYIKHQGPYDKVPWEDYQSAQESSCL